MPDIATGLEALRPWISTGGILGTLLLGMLYMRRLSMQAKVEDRQGYGKLIEALQHEVDRQADRHADCERRLAEVEAQLRGVHRQLVTHSANTGIALGSPSDDVLQAAKRVRKIVEKDE